MIKLKKSVVFFIGLLFAVFISFSFFGCDYKNENKTYDVAIRVKCSDGEIYEFSFGEREKHIEIPYDGVSRTFEVSKYWLKGYEYDGWLDIISVKDDKFIINCYKVVEGNRHEELFSINERGNYKVDIYTDHGIKKLTGDIYWSLSITIK